MIKKAECFNKTIAFVIIHCTACGDAIPQKADQSFCFILPGKEHTTAKKRKEPEELVIPVTAETLDVSKQKVTTGVVRVTKHVSERTERVDETGFREEVEVKRIPINRYVETPPEVQVEGDTTIIPVLEEVLVVEKRLLLKEEVRVTRKRKEVKSPQEVHLRSEDVKVEHVEADRSPK